MDPLVIKAELPDPLTGELTTGHVLTLARNLFQITAAGIHYYDTESEDYHLIPWAHVEHVTSASEFGSIIPA